MPRKRRQTKRILNCIPSQEQENDWRVEHAQEAGLVTAAPQIPTKKDLRAPWWQINDQGATGSCVGWASADSVIRWHLVTASRVGKNELLSPRFLWMAAKETDDFKQRPTTFVETEGTSLKSALDVARKFGVVKDSVLPFRSGKLYAGNAKTFYAIAAQLKISMYFNLGSELSDWRAWLATKGPILTRLDVDATWYAAGETKGTLDVYRPDTTRGGHAVALVGYTPQTFIVRNSWGTAWGDQGYGYASLAYARDAFKESYGVER